MTVGATKGKPTSLFILIPISLILLNVILAISAAISAHLSWGLAIVIAILLGLMTITISFFYREPSFSWTALMAVVAGLICGISINSYYDVKDREIVNGITLADAVNHREAGGYRFTEGTVRTNLMGTYAKRSESSRHSSSLSYYYAAPLVTDSWTPRQPVTVWVVKQSVYKKEHWEKPLRAGLRVEAIFKDDLAMAVREAESSHGLTSHPGAVMIEWVESPEEAQEAYFTEFKETALTFNIIWLVGLLCGRLYSYFRRKKKRTRTKT